MVDLTIIFMSMMRLFKLQIPHEVVEGDDDVAEFAECPWDWEKEEIEQYIEALHFRKIAEVFDTSHAAYGQLESWTRDQREELMKTVARIIEKCRIMMDIL